MKTTSFILELLLIIAVFISCEKPGTRSGKVPHSVREIVEEEDENATDITWYDKDGNAYFALFTFNDQNTKVRIH